jgi:phospholipid/cholesterol/gamma-HCH transport system permease protein
MPTPAPIARIRRALHMYLESSVADGAQQLRATGRWRAEHAAELERAVASTAIAGPEVVLDASHIEALDLTGAWFLRRLEQGLEARGVPHRWRGARPEPLEFAHQLIDSRAPAALPAPPSVGLGDETLDTLGRWTVRRGTDLHDALEFLGRIYFITVSALLRPRRFRFRSVLRHVYETGIQAVPIVALIAFLISVIVAYIGAQELRQFGGEVFVVDLVTLSVLRELGVLLTAIIVAGRSGSAFAAEIGVMRLNDEVDALRAIGMNVVEVLVLPRILGLMIALPLLTIIADAMGLAGGAVLSWLTLGIPFNQFLVRMQEAIAPTTFWAGLLKAPVFAFVIAAIGTFRGIQVRDSSRELGRLTTVAVVESIFMVLFVDAVFAVVYWKLDF